MTTHTVEKCCVLTALVAFIGAILTGASTLLNSALVTITRLAFGALVLIAIAIAKLVPAAIAITLIRRLC